jgi:hypothetical protein
MTLINRISRIDESLKNDDLRSYDPYDGLFSPIAPLLTFNNQFLSRVVQQVVFRSPVNLRPILGVKKLLHTKAISDFVSGYAILYAASKDKEHKRQCLRWLTELENIAVKTANGQAWGLRFPFATRFVQADAKTPNIFQTINAINAYLDVHEFVDNEASLDPVFAALNYIKTVFGYVENDEYVFWKYWSNLDQEIFNVSGLMVGVLSRLYTITRDESHCKLAVKTYNYLINRQNADGSWYYAHGERAKFIDGFHTGYILEGMMRSVIAEIITVDESFEKGVAFFLNNFFTEDKTPKYFHNKMDAHDIQNGAQAIQTLTFLSKLNYVSLQFVIDVFERVDKIFWNDKGYYDCRKNAGILYSIPMHRWATGPMFVALANLLKQSNTVKEPGVTKHAVLTN